MKKIIVLSLLLITCLSCGEDLNNGADTGMKKASLLKRQWEAVSMDWGLVGDLTGSGFTAMTHRLNFLDDDTFLWEITTREVHDGEDVKYDKITYTGAFTIISDSKDKMMIGLSGEDINYRATLDAERHLSIDDYYSGYKALIFISAATY